MGHTVDICIDCFLTLKLFKKKKKKKVMIKTNTYCSNALFFISFLFYCFLLTGSFFIMSRLEINLRIYILFNFYLYVFFVYLFFLFVLKG